MSLYSAKLFFLRRLRVGCCLVKHIESKIIKKIKTEFTKWSALTYNHRAVQHLCVFVTFEARSLQYTRTSVVEWWNARLHTPIKRPNTPFIHSFMNSVRADFGPKHQSCTKHRARFPSQRYFCSAHFFLERISR